MTVIHPSTKQEMKKEYSLLGYLIMNNFSEKVLGTLTYFIGDLNQPDSNGARPLSYALWCKNMVAIRLLLKGRLESVEDPHFTQNSQSQSQQYGFGQG